MRKIAIAAAFALAACGQSTTAPEAEAPAAPAGLMAEAQALAPEQQPVFAWTTLTAYQAAHPEATPPCASVRSAEARGIVPADVDPASVYGPHAGALVYSVQCGPQLTTVQSSPSEHWLVVMAPGATDAVVVNCAGTGTTDICPRAIPRAAAATP